MIPLWLLSGLNRVWPMKGLGEQTRAALLKGDSVQTGYYKGEKCFN